GTFVISPGVPVAHQRRWRRRRSADLEGKYPLRQGRSGKGQTAENPHREFSQQSRMPVSAMLRPCLSLCFVQKRPPPHVQSEGLGRRPGWRGGVVKRPTNRFH